MFLLPQYKLPQLRCRGLSQVDRARAEAGSQEPGDDLDALLPGAGGKAAGLIHVAVKIGKLTADKVGRTRACRGCATGSEDCVKVRKGSLDLMRCPTDGRRTVAARQMVSNEASARRLVDSVKPELLGREPTDKMRNTAQIDASGMLSVTPQAQVRTILRGARTLPLNVFSVRWSMMVSSSMIISCEKEPLQEDVRIMCSEPRIGRDCQACKPQHQPPPPAPSCS